MSTCRSVFKDKVFVFSNTVGGSGDKNNAGAAAFERKTGLQVITHAQQKPGGIEEVRAALADIPADSVVCIGDRVATDVLFANEHGYLSVLVDPVTTDEGALTRVVCRSGRVQARRLENVGGEPCARATPYPCVLLGSCRLQCGY